MVEKIEFDYIDPDPLPNIDTKKILNKIEKPYKKENPLRLHHLFGEAAYDAIIEWIAGTHSPEDVFSPDILVFWAETNGFIKVEKEK